MYGMINIINPAICFEVWYWRKLLRVPWTARRSDQSILKEINPKYSLEGLMLKLKFPYVGHLVWRADSSEKTLMLRKIEGRDEKGLTEDEMVNSVTDSVDMNLSKLLEIVNERGAWHAAVHEVAKSWTQLSDWTTTNVLYIYAYLYIYVYIHIYMSKILSSYHKKNNSSQEKKFFNSVSI